MIPVCWSAYEPEVQEALKILQNGKSSWEEAWEAMDFMCSVAQEGYTVQVFDRLAPCLAGLSTGVLLSLLDTLMDAHLRSHHKEMTSELLLLLPHTEVDLVMAATLTLQEVLLLNKEQLLSCRERVRIEHLWGFDVCLRRIQEWEVIL